MLSVTPIDCKNVTPRALSLNKTKKHDFKNNPPEQNAEFVVASGQLIVYCPCAGFPASLNNMSPVTKGIGQAMHAL